VITIFGDFDQFLAKKMLFFFKKQLHDPIFTQISTTLSPKRQFVSAKISSNCSKL
jgi:hypothetical protein